MKKKLLKKSNKKEKKNYEDPILYVSTKNLSDWEIFKNHNTNKYS